ncbi:VirD4-like conjugal transfer protein, CD1115 family [[Clostridium] polysaccharolyticum]|uniref:Type IV secretion system protein VirD4 n=1 Tax=[Clostridium] polysaccharolyticum TaxID=29364 RepID=A0A1H9Y8E3_9FIRM|nr:type IV secretory system conjugative DNA transfer family protein [[Clostridium] polysaccharolyticum]SES65093.1 type IV secretion system protein VirD4 [[Clostridium] polysaccharolyticum]
MIRKKIPLAILVFIISEIVLTYYFAQMDSMLRQEHLSSINLITIIKCISKSPKSLQLFGLIFMLSIVASLIALTWNNETYKSKQYKVTDNISIPIPAGQGQCGTAWWLQKADFNTAFDHFELDINHFKEWFNHNLDDIKRKDSGQSYLDLDKISISNGGIVLGKLDGKKGKETIFFNGQDSHVLTIGATRCGKGRTVVLESICTIGLAGKSMILTDPKAELFCYTSYFLKKLGYKIYTFDFKNPKKSSHYNYLQLIIDSVDQADIAAAIDYTWDLTSQLVGEAKGEKIWSNGEASIIAASIMAVVYDNRDPENKKYQNLTNVFYFISYMCTPITVGKNQVVPLNHYMKDLPEDHPSKGLLAVSEIAPSRTRGSFYTSALMTLRLFTSPYIAEMTSMSDYAIKDIGRDKTAVFIILPDDKETYYELAALYVSQIYSLLSKEADERGGRLKRDIEFVLDEFGNYAKIQNFMSMMTVGAGKGMKINPFLQDNAQLDAKYEKDHAKTIRGNCDTWLYLKANDTDTNELISKKLGPYTISTYSLGQSNQKYTNTSVSSNVSLMSRNLLTAEEVGRIRRPYTLVLSNNAPAIHYAPDLCSWNFNRILGMGSKKHNRKIMEARQKLRPEREVSEKLELWGIWNVYKSAIVKRGREEEEKQEQELFKNIMANMNF